jgi:hypothetical protein
MAEDEKTEKLRMFYYPDVQDGATKQGYIMGDIFLVVYGLWFLWGLFGPHH